MADRKIVVTLHTSEFRGDHAADVVIALDVPSHVDLRHLVNRHLARMGSEVDHIEIRVARGLDDA